MYVVFFEIFPKAKLVGGTGTQHILAMILGFLIFLPPIYFRKKNKLLKNSLKLDVSDNVVEHGEHSEEEEIPCPNLDLIQNCFNASIFPN